MLTGLVDAAVAALVVAPTGGCDLACSWAAALTLGGALAFLAATLTQLVHFHVHHAAGAWQPIEAPHDADEVDDPGYRWASKARLLCCAEATAVLERDLGAFEKAEDEALEPARTERLLRQPLRWLYPTAADALDALSVVWLARASGGTFSHTGFAYLALLLQLAIAVLAGVGPALTPGTTQALAQVVATALLQWGAAAYMLGMRPAADRVENVIVGVQFFCEGGATAALLLASLGSMADAEVALQATAFALALVALFLPIIGKVYDAVVVPLSRLRRQDDFSVTSACCALISLLASLPGFLAVTAGLSFGGGVDTDVLEGATDEAVGMAEAALEEGGTLAANLAWMTRPEPAHHRAANKIRRSFLLHRAGKAGRRVSLYDIHPSLLPMARRRRSRDSWLDGAVTLLRRSSSGSSTSPRQLTSPRKRSHKFSKLPGELSCLVAEESSHVSTDAEPHAFKASDTDAFKVRETAAVAAEATLVPDSATARGGHGAAGREAAIGALRSSIHAMKVANAHAVQLPLALPHECPRAPPDELPPPAASSRTMSSVPFRCQPCSSRVTSSAAPQLPRAIYSSAGRHKAPNGRVVSTQPGRLVAGPPA